MKTTRLNCLYVGCGTHRLKGFQHAEINIQKKNLKPPEILCDITKSIPLPDKSQDLIFSRHTLEHLTYKQLINHFLECNRLIKYNGYIRMCLPDFDLMIKDYLDKKYIPNSKLMDELDMIGPNENYTDSFINRILYPDHFYIHNYDTLFRALKKCGFSNIKRKEPGNTSIKNIEIKNELLSCEKGDINCEIILEAQKIDLPSVRHFDLKEKTKLINNFLSFFNLKITKFHHRKPRFPQRYWFQEKFFNLKKLFNFKNNS